jgi:peptide/nickel transport system substrate-binding protein
MDPHNISSVVSWNAVYNVCETLVTFEDGATAGRLVEDWSVDGTVYTFELTEGVSFHPPIDRELVAEDVVYSFDRMRSEDATTDDVRATVDRVEATGDHEFEIELAEPFGPFLQYLARVHWVVVPEEAVEEQGGSIGDLQEPVGTGPFVFEEQQPGDFLRLSAFDDYHVDGFPYADEVEITITPDEDARSLAVRNDDVDFARNVPYRDAETLESEDGTKVAVDEGAGWAQVHINCSREPWDDPAVRRAVAHVIDREAVVETTLAGYGNAAIQPFPEDNFWHYDQVDNARTRDVEAARSILEEAGNPLDGETLTIKTTSRYPVMETTAEILQANLAEAGIDAEIDNLEWGTMLDDFLNANFGAMAFSVPYKVDPDRHYHGFLQPDGWNQYGDDQPDADRMRELIEAGRTELDQDAREELYRELEGLVQKNVPWISVVHSHNVNGMRESVSGFEQWVLPYDRYWKLRKGE